MSIRRLAFTIFDDDLTKYAEERPSQWDNITYMIWQYEKCPKTEKIHVQGYCEFEKKSRFNLIKSNFPPGTHIEMAKGSQKSNIEYCSKSESKIGDTQEFGLRKSQGKDPEIDHFLQDIRELKSNEELIDEHPSLMMRYHNFRNQVLSASLETKFKHTRRNVECLCFWGDPRSGKTTKAFECFPELRRYKLPLPKDDKSEPWFMDYEGEEYLLIDDFKGEINVTMMKGILEGWPQQLPVKNSRTYAGWHKVVVTSNVDPKYWYPNIALIHTEAIIQRFTKITKLSRSSVPGSRGH